jgi:hypothetical protein
VPVKKKVSQQNLEEHQTAKIKEKKKFQRKEREQDLLVM